jgi:hypothetical protein
LRGPKLVWVPSKSGWMHVGTIGIRGLIQWIIIVNHMLSQVMKPSAHPILMPSQISEIQVLQHTSVIFKLWVIHWNYLIVCKLFDLKLAIGWSWANQGISLIDHFIWVHMSWLNWIYMQCCLL